MIRLQRRWPMPQRPDASAPRLHGWGLIARGRRSPARAWICAIARGMRLASMELHDQKPAPMRTHLMSISLSFSACMGQLTAGEVTGTGGGAAGAGSADAGPRDTTGSPREYFEANVSPPTRLRCAGCHDAEQQGPGGDFLGRGPTAYYAALKRNPRLLGATAEQSLFLTRGAHTGPAFEPAEQARAAEWVRRERATPGGAGSAGGSGGSPGGGPDAGPGAAGNGGAGNGRAGIGGSVPEALAAFGRCMSRSDFDANAVGTIALADTTQGPCHQCHAAGVGNLVLAEDPAITLDAARRLPSVLAWVTTSTAADGRVRDLLPAGRLRDKGL